MRDATREELESVDNYINSISESTGVHFYDVAPPPITGQMIQTYELNLDKVNTVDDCKKILKFLCRLAIEPTSEGIKYNGFEEVREYFET